MFLEEIAKQIDGLRARLGDHEFIVSHGLTRPDVARTYPDQAGALQSGFEAMVEAPRGAVHNLHFEARHPKGLWREIFNQANRCLAESPWELRGLDQELRHLAVE